MTFIYKFHGSHYEIGKQIGKTIKKEKINKIKINKNNYKTQLKIYSKFYPKFLEEIKGICDTTKINVDTLTYNTINSVDKSGCSVVYYDGMICRNYDWFINSIDLIELYSVKIPNYNNFICINDGVNVYPTKKDKNGFFIIDHQYIEPISGVDYINNKLLYIGVLFNNFTNKHIKNGLNPLHWMRCAIETCNNVDDVVKFVKVVPNSVPKFFFVADKNKNTIIIEHFGNLDHSIIYPKNNLLIHTNHILTNKYIRYDNKKTRTESVIRYNTIKKLIKIKKPLTLQTLLDIMNSNLIFQRYKNHPKTIYQLMINLKKKKLYYLWKGKKYDLYKYLKK